MPTAGSPSPASRRAGTTCDGITIAVGETRTLQLTGVVHASLADFGRAVVGCWFGTPATIPSVEPFTWDSARVLSDRTGNSTGRVYNIEQGFDAWVAGVVIGLVDPDTNRVIVKTRTNAAGRFTFRDVPAGMWWVRVYGPWKPSGEVIPLQFGPCGPCQDQWTFAVVPGPNVPEEPGPFQPPLPGPDDGSLPATGASVASLTAAGGLLVALGVAMVLVGRPRQRRTSW